MKKEGWKREKNIQDIECFKNTGMGIYISFLPFFSDLRLSGTLFGLSSSGLIGVIACVIILSFDDEMEYVLPAAEVAKIEQSMYKDNDVWK